MLSAALLLGGCGSTAASGGNSGNNSTGTETTKDTTKDAADKTKKHLRLKDSLMNLQWI